ncbi:MAG: FAD-dependent oxidoreductase [Alphaproteobacteria bacterium]|nr:FAD-dependent oxidoreductase [Alphaproteobacteria bacterium]
MNETARHIVIVGAGHAGGVAAATLRQTGFAGAITLIGSEPYPPHERPPLSKELLAGAIPVEKTYLRPLAFYADNRIVFRPGEIAVAIDRTAQRVTLKNGDALSYDTLLLTMGARARRLSLPGADHPRVLYLRDIADSLALREHLKPGVRAAVIGAGFIGLEAAAAARKRGAAVTVLEVQREPLQRVCPPEIGCFMADLHRRNGVELRTGVRITAIAGADDALALYTADGGTVAADIVLAGIGAQPNVELAQAAGLAVDNGILTDEFGRTSDPHIFAAGDVTRHFNPLLGRKIRLEAWQNAQNQAIAVAKVMAGGNQPYAEVPWFWTDQYDVNLQIAGAPERWGELVWRGGVDNKAFTLFAMEGGIPVAAITMNNGRDMRAARELIARRRAIDPARLADTQVKLQDLAKESAGG